jgi:dihydropteroate synthase
LSGRLFIKARRRDISAESEKERVLAAIRLIKMEFPEAVISVVTFRADIAREAVIDCGITIINDLLEV